MKTSEEKKAKDKQWNINRKVALKTVVEYILTNAEEMPEEVVEAAKTCKSQRQASSGKGIKAVIAELFREKNVVHQNELFLDHNLGRVEVRNICNDYTKLPGDEKMWIDFNKEDGNYTLCGTGSDIPEGYTGYLPPEYKQEVVITEEDEDIDDEPDNEEVDE